MTPFRKRVLTVLWASAFTLGVFYVLGLYTWEEDADYTIGVITGTLATLLCMWWLEEDIQ